VLDPGDFLFGQFVLLDASILLEDAKLLRGEALR